MTDVSAQGPTPFEVQLGRRRFLGCAALFGVAGPLLVACSGGSADDASGSSGNGSTSDGGSSSSGGSGGDVLVATADVPVGGGVILTDIVVAVTQPTEGEFKAFDAHCTHQGSELGEPNSQGVMTCPLHGSQFNVDGENIRGPNGGAAGTTANLTEIPVKVQGKNVVRA
jgi:nitrite reductase/ring-hydroxylating ferredoxin subunit